MDKTTDFSRLEMMQAIIDDFKKTTFRILKKGIKDIDATHSNWEQDYDSLSREIYLSYSREHDGAEEPSTSSVRDGSSIEALAEHIKSFKGFDLDAYLTNALEKNKKAFIMKEDLPEVFTSNDLNREFWKVSP